MVETLVAEDMVCSVEERDSLREEVSSLKAQLSAEKQKFEVLYSSIGSAVADWRQIAEKRQKQLLRAQIDNDLYSLYLQDREAEFQRLLKQKEDNFREKIKEKEALLSSQEKEYQELIKRRDAQVVDLERRFASASDQVREAEVILMNCKRQMEDAKMKNEDLQQKCSQIPALEEQILRQEKELVTLKESLAGASALKRKEKNKLRAFWIHRFRLASFHAFTDFEWAPVKALLESKLAPHEKETKLLEEEPLSSEDEV